MLIQPTPIFNRPDLLHVYGKDGLLFDDKGLVRALEYIALPGTKIEIIDKCTAYPHILQIWTDNYPKTKPLYMDDRFSYQESAMCQQVTVSRDEAIARLWNFPRSTYVWGGNYSAGLSKMVELYPPPSITPFEHLHWSFTGVDCSGLYYEVLNGGVPRNTRELLSSGREVSVNALEPLDLLIWPGHMVIVLDSGKVIESRHADGGVIMRDFKERLDMIDNSFICKRYF